MSTGGVKRGCGTRVKGGIYAECAMGPNGMPVEHFLMDPPVKVDAEAMGLRPVGVTLIERDGVTHIVDWVGSEHYPNVADFIEEVKRYGLSRRLPKTLDFSRLTRQSRIILAHARADIVNTGEFYAELRKSWGMDPVDCPKWTGGRGEPDNAYHTTEDEMCAGLWWYDAEPHGEEIPEGSIHGRYRREMPGFSYNTAFAPPEGFKRRYRLALFASFPITALAVIRDDESGAHGKALETAAKAAIPISLENE